MPFPPDNTAMLRTGSNATEDPSILPGEVEPLVVWRRPKPTFARGTTDTGLNVFAGDISTATKFNWGVTHPVLTFGIPFGKLTGNDLQVLI